jgi:hypothetical protein
MCYGNYLKSMSGLQNVTMSTPIFKLGTVACQYLRSSRRQTVRNEEASVVEGVILVNSSWDVIQP